MRKVEMRLLHPEDMQKIHDFSMKLLDETGVKVPSEMAQQIFREHGFRVDGQMVHITEEQVYAALKTAPSHFVLHGRDEKKSLDLGGGAYGVAGPIGPVNVMTLDEGVRKGTLKDVENLVKIYQGSDVVNMNSNNGVEANDIDVSIRPIMITKRTLHHTDKPFYTRLFTYEQMNAIMDMIEITVGEKLVAGGKAFVAAGSTPSISPLSWSKEVLEGIIALAQRGQVVTTGTATSCGITGPIRPFGTLVLQNAEVLSGIVLAQLVNPGNPVGYGTAATPGNLRGARSAFGTPGVAALQLGFIEMGKEFYHLPTRTLTYSTDSTNVDVQCGIECYESTMANILGGADYMLSEIGTLNGLMTTSYEKTILDEEITSRLLYMHKGIEVSEEAAAIEDILETGVGGTFITSEDTLDYMMDDWYPKYTDWNTKVAERPVGDYEFVLRRANEEWKRRLEEAPETLLSPETAKDLDAYIESKNY